MLAIAGWHFPIISASTWLGLFVTREYFINEGLIYTAMLLGMSASWVIIGRPRYTTMVDGQIYPY